MSTEPESPTHPDKWALLIPDYFPPSLNKTQRRHWSVVRKHKAKAKEMLNVYCLLAGGQPVFEGHVIVTIWRLWGKGQRGLDRDNLWGSVKPLIDALRKPKGKGNRRQGGLGIVEDDDDDVMELRVRQRKGDTSDTMVILQNMERVAGLDVQLYNPQQITTLILIEGKRVDEN